MSYSQVKAANGQSVVLAVDLVPAGAKLQPEARKVRKPVQVVVFVPVLKAVNSL
jgi:hypothetical protein